MDHLRRGWARLIAWVQGDLLITDAVLAAALILLLSNSDITSGLLIPQSRATVFFWNLILILPICIRRRMPDLAPKIFLAISATQLILGPALTGADLSALILIFSALVYGSRSSNRTYIIAGYSMGGAAALVQALVQTRTFKTIPVEGQISCTGSLLEQGLLPCSSKMLQGFLVVFVTYELMLTVAILLAYWTRARKHTLLVAGQHNEALVFRAQEERELAASAERARVARDMHDVVAHTLSILIIQSDAGRYATASNPDMAMQTMSTISEESRRALQELNSLFGTIGHKEDDSALASINPPTDFQEEYRAGIPISYPLMESMIDQARQFSVGRTLTHRVRGDPRPDLLGQERIAVAYRVVQEALSNVRKHAGLGARVLVQEDWDGRGLRMTIDDQADLKVSGGRMERSDHIGYGLKGMLERLSSIGGFLETGPLPPKGFRVRATIPLQPVASDAVAVKAEPSLGKDSDLQVTEDRFIVPGALKNEKTPKGVRTDQSGRRGEYRPNLVERASTWLQEHYLLVDIFLVVLLTLNFGLGILDVYGTHTNPPPDMARPLQIMVSQSVLFPLIIRRRLPELSAVLVATACALQIFFSPLLFAADICVVVSIYSAITYGNSRTRHWVPLVVLAEFFLLGLRISLIIRGATSIFEFLTQGIRGTPIEMNRQMFLALTVLMGVAIMLCLISILAALWHRSRGSSLLLLKEREKALNQGLHEGRILAANKERERIGASMQAEVAATLDAIIRRTEKAKDLLAEARNLGVEPDPDQVTQAFEEIGRQGREALTRLRQLLAVLHQSSQTEPGRDTRRETPNLSPANPLPVSSISPEEDGQVGLS